MYPINVRIQWNGEKISKIEEFILNYDEIVNDKFKKVIEDSYTRFLFNN